MSTSKGDQVSCLGWKKSLLDGGRASYATGLKDKECFHALVVLFSSCCYQSRKCHSLSPKLQESSVLPRRSDVDGDYGSTSQLVAKLGHIIISCSHSGASLSILYRILSLDKVLKQKSTPIHKLFSSNPVFWPMIKQCCHCNIRRYSHFESKCFQFGGQFESHATFLRILGVPAPVLYKSLDRKTKYSRKNVLLLHNLSRQFVFRPLIKQC